MTTPKFCRQCGTALTPSAHFCANCGLNLGAPASPAGGAAAARPLAAIVPWFILASLLMAVFGYLVGSRSAPAAGAAGVAGATVADGGDGPIVSAPDISTLSPEERVDRLFNRVMTLSAAGKRDSVAFFAPMAINALAALMPLDLHRRYDLGLIHLAAGEDAEARAQADTILAAQKTHLLGLALAMRVAAAEGRTADAKRLGALLTASAARERATGKQEYTDHAPDIAEALDEAAGRRVSPLSRPR